MEGTGNKWLCETANLINENFTAKKKNQKQFANCGGVASVYEPKICWGNRKGFFMQSFHTDSHSGVLMQMIGWCRLQLIGWLSSCCLLRLVLLQGADVSLCFFRGHRVCVCGLLSVRGHLPPFCFGLSLTESILFSGISGFWEEVELTWFCFIFTGRNFFRNAKCSYMFNMHLECVCVKQESISHWKVTLGRS